MSDFMNTFLLVVLIILGICVFGCLVRAVMGPTLADRIVAINMIGTVVIMIIAVLTIYMSEAWLADVAAVYAMISFLAVVVLTKIYIGVYREKHLKDDTKKGNERTK